MQDVEFVNGLIDFIKNSPTPFHAVESMAQVLDHHGYTRLDEADQWSIDNAQQSGRYYVIRNGSSIIAFQLNQPLAENGICMVGAHTDSPCLQVKPNPEIVNNSYLQLGVEVYGGALLNPWFDRDLSLAGRVSYLDESGAIDYQLINLKKPVAIIPSLAIHLDREANENRSINKQTHLPPILMKMPETDAEGSSKADFKEILLKIINTDMLTGKAVRVLDYELSFYDVQPPAVIGLHDDFIASARLDNLLSCYTGLMALLNSDSKQNTLLVCT
ncbi:MAG: M18 family aminopeptidase, partial [Gammaproteobacteria bacterium]|nr:M18 family aminopeptidase [Gammaproteobacteria bacterium]